MTTKRDYYEVLEVGSQASEEDIRKAFRKKAMEYHPDRNKADDASDRFKEVNEAYQVLSDPERRSQYDRFGHAGVKSGAGTGGFDGFEGFGGFGDIFEAFFGGGTRTRARAGADLQARISLTFEEAAFGATREVEVSRTEKCGRCSGTRAEPGTHAETCSNCRGSGRVRRTQRSGFGQFMTEAVCNVCSGSGQQVRTLCTQCKGTGRERTKRRIQVSAPAGIPDGVRLNLQGQGDTGEFGGPPGDLLVTVHVKPHPYFERQEHDVLYDCDVTFPAAALGTEMEVPTLHGPVQLKVPAGTQSGETFRLKGKGIPHLGRADRRGDQLVSVHVITPEKLSKEQKHLLEELQRSMEPR